GREPRPGRAAGADPGHRPGPLAAASGAGRRQPPGRAARPGGDRRRRPARPGGRRHPGHLHRAAADRPRPRGAGDGGAQRRAPDRVRPRRPPGAARRAAQPRRARRRPAGHFRPGRHLPLRLPGGHHRPPAPGREPGFPGRRADPGRAPGPRPRRAAAAPGGRAAPGITARRGGRGGTGWAGRGSAVAGATGRRPDGGAPMSRMRDGGWVLPASLAVALLLGLLPLHPLLQPLRPYWVALVLGYWVLETPERAGLGLAFGAGLAADLVYGELLGEQALRLVILVFILQRFRARLRFFP